MTCACIVSYWALPRALAAHSVVTNLSAKLSAKPLSGSTKKPSAVANRRATVVDRSGKGEEVGQSFAVAARCFGVAAAASVALLAADPACAELNARGTDRDLDTLIIKCKKVPKNWMSGENSFLFSYSLRKLTRNPHHTHTHTTHTNQTKPTEANRGGEFNRGSAQQFGGYDLTNTDVVREYGADLRLSNFTGAEMRKANLKGANLTVGRYKLNSC